MAFWFTCIVVPAFLFFLIATPYKWIMEYFFPEHDEYNTKQDIEHTETEIDPTIVPETSEVKS